MIRTALLATIVLLSASSSFAGGGFGGNPPALADEEIQITKVAFKTLIQDVIKSPNSDFKLNGRTAKPLLIDVQSNIMRFESSDKKIIDVSQIEAE